MPEHEDITGVANLHESKATLYDASGGEIISSDGSEIFIKEQAAAAADRTGYGQIWVKSDSPNNLYFTDDAGNDIDLTAAGGGISNVVEDTTPQLGGPLDAQGEDITSGGVIFLTEQAAAESDVAGQGQFWVKNDTPNVPMFTDDAGTDYSLFAGTGDFLADGTVAMTGNFNINTQDIEDANSNELLSFTTTASAVNEFTIANAATSGAPVLSATGGDTNIGITLTPKGTGNVTLGTMVFDSDQSIGAGQDNYVLTYDDGTGLISLEAAAGGGGLADLVDDTTPQLGGALDVNGQTITSASSGNIVLDPDGSGVITIGSSMVPNTANQFDLGSSGSPFKRLYVKASVGSIVPINVAAASGQSGNLLAITANGGSEGDLFKVGPTGNVHVGSSLIVPTQTPASASATGTAGTITWDSSYIYICSATDTWLRVAIATW